MSAMCAGNCAFSGILRPIANSVLLPTSWATVRKASSQACCECHVPGFGSRIPWLARICRAVWRNAPMPSTTDHTVSPLTSMPGSKATNCAMRHLQRRTAGQMSHATRTALGASAHGLPEHLLEARDPLPHLLEAARPQREHPLGERLAP